MEAETKEENLENQKEETIKEDKKEKDKNEEDKKEEKKEEDKNEEKKEEDKKEDEKEEDKKDKKLEDEKTRKKREKEEKKRLKKEKEKEEKERKKKEKEEKKKLKLEKEKEEKEKKKEEKEKKKKEKEEKKKKEKEESLKLATQNNIIYSIDEENKKCVDCGGENPTKVSINNGIIVCEKCAKEHEKLGHSISFIKNVEDDFDEFLINFIVMGSNTKFKRFLTQEKVDSTLPIASKYKTNAVCFYRKNLKAKVEGKKAFEKDYEDPNGIIDEEQENIFPEFNKKYVIKKQVLHKGSLISQQRFTFKNIFNKVFMRNKKKRGRSLEKEKKKGNDIEVNDLDINKTVPPEFITGNNKEVNMINMLESNRPFQEEDKKEDKKDEEIGRVISTGLK